MLVEAQLVLDVTPVLVLRDIAALGLRMADLFSGERRGALSLDLLGFGLLPFYSTKTYAAPDCPASLSFWLPLALVAAPLSMRAPTATVLPSPLIPTELPNSSNSSALDALM